MDSKRGLKAPLCACSTAYCRASPIKAARHGIVSGCAGGGARGFRNAPNSIIPPNPALQYVLLFRFLLDANVRNPVREKRARHKGQNWRSHNAPPKNKHAQARAARQQPRAAPPLDGVERIAPALAEASAHRTRNVRISLNHHSIFLGYGEVREGTGLFQNAQTCRPAELPTWGVADLPTEPPTCRHGGLATCRPAGHAGLPTCRHTELPTL